MSERFDGVRALRAGLPPLRGLLPLVLLIAGWQILNPRHSPYFPPPSAWWTAAAALAAQGKLVPALASTLATFALGLAIALVLGAALGILVGRVSAVRRALGPLFEFCRGLPPPVIVPLAVLLLGYAESLKLLVVAWVAVWPILLNAASAANRIDSLLIDVARTFRLDWRSTLRRIVLPAIVPEILLGVRVAMPLAIIVTLLVEMLTSLPGIGSMIVTSQRQYHSAEVYGLLIVVGVMGFVVNYLFLAVERLVLRRWPPRAAGYF